MLLNLLKSIIEADPFTSEVNLENSEVTALDSNSCDLLGRLQNLRVLNLSENYLTKLPSNLSMLKNLVEININGNPIDDVELAVDALKTVGPQLKALSINLHEEEQVDYLLRHLSHMEILNGIKVEREALFDNSDEDDEEQTDSNRKDEEEEQLQVQLLPAGEDEDQEAFQRKQSAQFGRNNSQQVNNGLEGHAHNDTAQQKENMYLEPQLLNNKQMVLGSAEQSSQYHDSLDNTNQGEQPESSWMPGHGRTSAQNNELMHLQQETRPQHADAAQDQPSFQENAMYGAAQFQNQMPAQYENKQQTLAELKDGMNKRRDGAGGGQDTQGAKPSSEETASENEAKERGQNTEPDFVEEGDRTDPYIEQQQMQALPEYAREEQQRRNEFNDYSHEGKKSRQANKLLKPVLQQRREEESSRKLRHTGPGGAGSRASQRSSSKERNGTIQSALLGQDEAINQYRRELSVGKMNSQPSEYRQRMSHGETNTQQNGSMGSRQSRSRSLASNKSETSNASGARNSAGHRSNTHQSLRARDSQKSAHSNTQTRNHQQNNLEFYSQQLTINQQLQSRQLVSSSSSAVPHLTNQTHQNPVIDIGKNQQNHPGPDHLIQDLTTPVYDQIPSISNIQEFASPIGTIGPLDGLNCQEAELSSTDLESIAIIYDKIRQVTKHSFLELFKRQNTHVEQQQLEALAHQQELKDQALAQDFDDHLTQIMGQLNQKLQCLPQEADENSQTEEKRQALLTLRQSLIMQTKHSLIELCFQKTRESMQKMDEDSNNAVMSALDSILMNIVTFTGQIQNSHFGLLQEQAMGIIRQDPKSLEDPDDPHSATGLLRCELQTVQASHELKDLEIRELKLKIAQMEQQNQKLQEIVNSSNRQSINQQQDNMHASITQDHQTFQPDLQNMQNNSMQDEGLQIKKKKTKKAPRTQNQSKFLSLNNHKASQELKPKAAAPKELPMKVIPLKQLKDIICDMYSQKVKYDQKCRESSLRIETMEQFMYTYLNQKYGLKTLIIEWASTLITGIKTYLRDDHEITLFAKILKNECDEEFRFVQAHVKESLANMLRQVLREKYAQKSEKEISQECEAIQNSQIEDWQWKKIIYKMYEREDAAYLCNKFQELIEKRRAITEKENDGHVLNDEDIGYFASQKHNQQKLAKSKNFVPQAKKSKSKQRLTRDEEMQMKKQQQHQFKLVYAHEFLKGILDFQLQEHERFLYEFNLLFKQVDADSDGIINEDQFRDLIYGMKVVVQNEQNAQHDIDTLLRVVDPHNNQQMTYSEVVQLLSNQLVPQQSLTELKNQLVGSTQTNNLLDSQFSGQNMLDPEYNGPGVQGNQVYPDQYANHSVFDQTSPNLTQDVLFTQDVFNVNQIKLVPILEKFYNFQNSQNATLFRSEAAPGIMADDLPQQEEGPMPSHPQLTRPSDFSADEAYNHALRGNLQLNNSNLHDNARNPQTSTELSVHPTLEARVQQNIGHQSLQPLQPLPPGLEYQHHPDHLGSIANQQNPSSFGLSSAAAEPSNHHILDDASAQFSNRQLIRNMNIGGPTFQNQHQMYQATHDQHGIPIYQPNNGNGDMQQLQMAIRVEQNQSSNHEQQYV